MALLLILIIFPFVYTCGISESLSLSSHLHACIKLCDKIYTISKSISGFWFDDGFIYFLCSNPKSTKPWIYHLHADSTCYSSCFRFIVYVQISPVFVQKIFIKLCEWAKGVCERVWFGSFDRGSHSHFPNLYEHMMGQRFPILVCCRNANSDSLCAAPLVFRSPFSHSLNCSA